ncbi:hypothetical protein [Actinomadura sp. 9N407]|uniref:hypothetical protein n=1 Tax=Actinomadura sp. 9N407 TaxID=3375154 RepID=UPI0037881CBA
MTSPRTPDEEPGGDRPQTESPEQRPAEEPAAGGPAAPPPPQWLDEGQAPPGAHLLPEPPPLPPEGGGTEGASEAVRPEDQTLADQTIGDVDDGSTQVFDRGTAAGSGGPPAADPNMTVTDLADFMPFADKSAAPAEPEAEASPDSDKTSVFSSTPPPPATEQIPEARSVAESAAKSPEPPAPPAAPSAPVPFPYAQDIPGAPLPAPPPPAPTAPPGPPEPFPWAQEIPDTPGPQSYQAPAPPEPFPWAQEIPGTPAPEAAAPAPPAPEPFPWAQQVPGPPQQHPMANQPWAQEMPNAPQPQAQPYMQAQASPQPVAPPPQIEEPWRTPAPPKRKGKGVKKGLFIGVGGLAAAALVAGGGFFVVNMVGGDSGGEAGAKLAGSVFAADPATRTDGRDQQLTSVASAGATVVAVGYEADPRAARGRFLVSGDGGRTFKVAKVEDAGGGEPGPGELPRVVAGSEKGWIAIGVRAGGGGAVWTSQDGTSWRRLPDMAGQQFGANSRVRRVVASSSGYLAIGTTSKKGDFKDAEPAVWTSADGTRWEVKNGNKMGLPFERGEIQFLEAATSGNVVLLEGLHTANPGGGKPQVGRRAFRSDDGGATWTESKVPVPKGTRGLMVGGGPGGFLAIREIRAGGKAYGQAFTSKDGSDWTQTGRLESAGYQRTSSVLASGQGYAAVVVRGRDVAISRSQDGATWQDAGAVPMQKGRSLLSSTLSEGQAVMVGSDSGTGELDALLGVWDGSGAQVPVDLGKIPGAVRPDHAVTAVGASADRAVAVGSTGGDAAVWTSQDGTAWTRGQGAQNVLSRKGTQQLTSVTSGKAGWLAVGSDQVNPRRPLVVTSADGAAWQAADAAEQFRPAKNTSLATYAATSGPSGYVIAGEDGLSAAVWFSADLKTWERGASVGNNGLEALPNSNRWMRGVTAAQSGYVAVGGLRDPAAGGGPGARPAVWTSPDGKQWTLQQLQLPGGVAEGTLTHVAAKGDVVVAAGVAGAASLAYISADGGKTWKQTPLANPEGTTNLQVTALTATPKGFALTGTSGPPNDTDVVSWTSADGTSWTGAEQEGEGLAGGGEQAILGLVTFKDRLLGVGRSSGTTGEQPVLWDRPVP